MFSFTLLTERNMHMRAEKSNFLPHSAYFSRTIKVILEPDSKVLLDIPAQRLQICSMH